MIARHAQPSPGQSRSCYRSSTLNHSKDTLMQRRTLIQSALIMPPAVAFLSGCAATAKSMPTPYVVSVKVDSDVNLNARGHAVPILVKVFELKSSASFESADYFSLQDRDRETLGAELVNTDRAMLRGGEQRAFKREAGLDSRAIGIIAGYRKLESAHWRLVLPLKEPKQTNLYKIWQSTPSTQEVRIAIRKTGIEIVRGN
ncbi:MAG: type VI secretion system lipoprotein TssJ [Burkholderiaceae bacterium]|nr:type VI secretion system lipoprotein TssJ [Burkholderiaceae bacterium]